VALSLRNPGFEGLRENSIWGWSTWAEDNFEDKETYDPETSLDTPLFRQADDPSGMIDGATLQIDATAFVKYKVHVYQTVEAPPNTPVRFQAKARVRSDGGGVRVAAGVDPSGGPNCHMARWGDVLVADQSSGMVRVVAPDVVAGRAGNVTVCLYAETVFPEYRNTTFFDSATLIANPK
jgi:hypothetical protein